MSNAFFSQASFAHLSFQCLVRRRYICEYLSPTFQGKSCIFLDLKTITLSTYMYHIWMMMIVKMSRWSPEKCQDILIQAGLSAKGRLDQVMMMRTRSLLCNHQVAQGGRGIFGTSTPPHHARWWAWLSSEDEDDLGKPQSNSRRPYLGIARVVWRIAAFRQIRTWLNLWTKKQEKWGTWGQLGLT